MDFLFSIVFVIAILFSLITGKKRTERELGYVAEVCPQCSTARSVKVSRVGLAHHLFYVALGRGELLGFSGQCQQCSSVFPVQAMDYAAIETNANTGLESLVARTNPKLDPNREPDLVAIERLAQICDPFFKVSAGMADRYSSGIRLDLPTALAFIAACGLPIWVGYSIPNIPFSFDAALFVFGVAGALIVLSREPRRFFQSQIRTDFVKALRPLNPEREELDACLLALKQHGGLISKFVTTQGLLQDLSEIAPASITPTDTPAQLPMQDTGPRGKCPSCGAEIALDSPECPVPQCKALFGPGSTWKVGPI
jgi:hypothetical protein